MKKMVFIAGALMVLVAGSAMAGSNLAWNDCVPGGGVADRTAACANTGSGTMYISFVSPTALPQLAASDAFIDVQTSTSISNWWMTTPIGTRWGTGSADGASGACPGWWSAATSGPIVFAPTAQQISSTRFRLRVSAVVAAGEEQPVDAGVEYGAGQLILKNSAGTGVAGSPANTECLQGGAIGIVNLTLLQPGQADVVMQTAEVRNCVTSRGGGGQTCPGATPTKKATWGSIKAIYR